MTCVSLGIISCHNSGSLQHCHSGQAPVFQATHCLGKWTPVLLRRLRNPIGYMQAYKEGDILTSSDHLVRLFPRLRAAT